MQLTKYSDYSLRVLVYLGIQLGEKATITEISEAFGISRNHLVKVVHQLGKKGYIQTKRGKAGGIHMAVDPATINIGDVVRHTEPHMNLVECFHIPTNTCPIVPVCALKNVLVQAQKKFMEELDQCTLADILPNPEQLQGLLKKT